MQCRDFQRRAVLLCGSLIVCSLAACDSEQKVKLYPVRGQIFFDGKPTEGALVSLYAQDQSIKLEKAPTAYVKADGSFTLTTFEPEDGAPVGEYQVSIMWYPPDAAAVMARTGVVPNLLPSMYSDPRQSGLKIQVLEKENELPAFQLKSKK